MANHGSKYEPKKKSTNQSDPIQHYESVFSKGYRRFFEKRGIDIKEEEQKEQRATATGSDLRDLKSHKKAVAYGRSYRQNSDPK